jgi:hypothetical protein
VGNVKKIVIIFLIFSFALLLSACDSQSVNYPEPEDYIAVETEIEIDLVEEIEQEVYRPITIVITINETPATFRAYEISGELLFSLEDLSHALERTQARFWFSDAHGIYARSFFNDIATQSINDRIHATLWDIGPLVGFEIETQPGNNVIVINTNEPYIPEYQRQAIIDFLFGSYPQLFTFEQVWEDFGYGSGWWFASRFSLFDLNDGIPGISIRFDDAGSWANRTYKFIDGKYRLTDLPHFAFMLNDDETPAARQLIGLRYQVIDAVNQELWPSLKTLPSGIAADTRLCDEVIDLIITFFNNTVDEWTVNEIRKSQISEGLLRVEVTHSVYNFPDRYWIEICSDGDDREVLRYFGGWWMWDYSPWEQH